MTDGFAYTLKDLKAACHLVCATWSVASVTDGSRLCHKGWRRRAQATRSHGGFTSWGRRERRTSKSAAIDRLGVTMWKYTAILLPVFTANKYTTVCLCCSLRFCMVLQWFISPKGGIIAADVQVLFEMVAAMIGTGQVCHYKTHS